jgi:acyl-CoA synthetase (AMP-forming)/AMP-acid ligase II
MRRIATGLARLGVRSGTRVAVGLPNGDRALLVHAALRELRAVMVPLVPGLTRPELVFQLTHSAAEVLVVGEPVSTVLAPPVREASALRTVIRDDAEGLSAMLELTPRAPSNDTDDEAAPWAIFYTSGSTGRPKGVVLPAGAFVSAGTGYADRFGVRQEDNYILPTPMAHAVGGLTAPSMALYTGCRLTIVDRFRPSAFWQQVQDTEATVSILFPAHLNLLLELESDAPPASSLRLVITHAWHEAFRRRFGVELGLCWGMTETGGTSTGAPPGERGDGPGCVGWGMHGVEVAIVDGEILLRHRHRMLGYLDDPQATNDVLDADGWIHSGDRGELDAHGRLYYRGRIKNMIKRSGENVSPEEIETAIEAHPAVAECLVLGVPDQLRTEEVAAVVVLSPGSELAPAELIAFLAARLARFKLPRYVEVRGQPLPRLAAGKINRPEIARRFDATACWDRQQQTDGG